MPRATKRSAGPAAEESIAKRAVVDHLKQQGITASTRKGVEAILEHPCCELPEVSRRMLLAMLPWSVGVTADARMEIQSRVVEMFEEAAAGVKEKLQAAVSRQAARCDDAAAQKASLEGAVKQALAACAEAKEIVEESKSKLADASSALLSRKKAVASAEAAQKDGSKGFQTVQAQRARVEGTLSIGFPKLRDGSCEEAEKDAVLKSAMACAEELELDASMLTALPRSLAQKNRGPFDKMVVDQFEEKLREKMASLLYEEKAAEPAALARKAAVEEAKAECSKAVSRQQAVAAEFGAKQDQLAFAASKLSSAQQARTVAEPILKAVSTETEEIQTNLQGFCDYNIACLEMLRDQKKA